MTFNPPIVPAAVEVICCDYFDTIVFRTICPEDVKRQWAARLVSALEIDLKSASMYAERARIEIELCERNFAAGNDLEFNVLECYEALWDRLSKHSLPPLQDFILLCQDLELSIERYVQCLDNEVVNWIRAMVAEGKKAVLVSDFYLPEAIFRQLLQFHGIENLFAQVYVSADRLLTKRSGRVFSSIISDLDTSPEKMLMIGDNAEADYNQPMKHNIFSVQLDRSDRHQTYLELAKVSGDCSEIRSEISAYLYSDDTKPFPELAFTLFCFTERLYFSLLKANVSDVFFLAREGQFLKKIFDKYQEDRGLSGKLYIKTHYLQVSRRSTFLPSLGPLEDETFDTLFRQYRKISAREFLLNLGLEALLPQLGVELSKYDLSTRHNDFPTSELFESLKNSISFQIAYETTRLKERDAFFTYLNSFERLCPSDSLCIVDVGWKGTIQDNLHRLFTQAEIEQSGPNFALIGMYLGLVAPGNVNPRNQKRGLLFSALTGWTPQYSIFNENRALFEVMLAADHGSAASYYENAEGHEVILSEFIEEPLFRSRILPIQEWLLCYFQNINDLLARRHYDSQWLLEQAAEHHARMVFQPTTREIHWFTDVYHVENFGVFESSTFQNKTGQRDHVFNLKFAWTLLKKRKHVDWGFWPWLTCLHQGGHLIAWCYRTYRLWTLLGPFRSKSIHK